MSNIAGKGEKIFPIICNQCKHHISGVKCKAFDIIPDKIILGESKHTKVYLEQKGDFTFTKK